MGQRARGSLGQDSQVRRGLKLCEQCPLGGCQSRSSERDGGLGEQRGKSRSSVPW